MVIFHTSTPTYFKIYRMATFFQIKKHGGEMQPPFRLKLRIDGIEQTR